MFLVSIVYMCVCVYVYKLTEKQHNTYVFSDTRTLEKLLIQ